MTEMEKIVEILKKRGLPPDAGLGDIIKMLRREAGMEDKKETKEEDLKLIFNEYSVTVVWPSGINLAFYANGTSSVSWNGKTYEDGEIAGIEFDIPVKTMQQVLQYLCSYNVKNLERMVEYNKVLKEKCTDEKTRWIKSGNKRAFIAGMILGQQKP